MATAQEKLMLLSQMRKLRPRKFQTFGQGNTFGGEAEIQIQVYTWDQQLSDCYSQQL